MENLNGLK